MTRMVLNQNGIETSIRTRTAHLGAPATTPAPPVPGTTPYPHTSLGVPATAPARTINRWSHPLLSLPPPPDHPPQPTRFTPATAIYIHVAATSPAAHYVDNDSVAVPTAPL